MKSQLKAGAVLSYVALFISSAISLIYTPIMLNLLGQSEYGLYSLATTAAGFVGVLNFGLGNAVIRYTAKYKTLKDEEGCYRLYGTFSLMYGVLGIIALASGIILTLNSHQIFSNSLSIAEVDKLVVLMWIMVINISLGIGSGLFSVIVLAHEKFIFQKVISIASSILNPLIMLPLLFMGYGSISVAIVTTAINLITILVNTYYCFRVLRIKILFRKIEPDLLKEIIVFSSYLFLNLIIDKIYWSTDPFILGIYSGTAAISIYTIGVSFTGYFSGFSAAISNVFLSKVTGMVTNEVSDKEISDLFIRIGRVQYIILSFALSGFVVFGQEFIILWVGKIYSSSFIIAIIILVPMIISLTQSMGIVILQAKNKHKFRSVVYFALAIANVLLSIILVQRWGAIGCALATAAAFTIGNIIIMNIYYWKKLNIAIPSFWKNIIYMSSPLIISILFGVTLNKLVLTDSWSFFIIKIIVFSVVYSLLIWFAGMNCYEKDLFVVPFKKIIHRFSKGKLYKMS
ncbi:oligosaccharide flippase family protein [Paenibacillus sp. V4I7]|uniref:oligosaccharide flippase family protein n=1 Tax=Paenibacillus sp. V4I7 TaxID=3042307 RepID=UPI002780D96A|nr:oligosaccharide flippase family protein [Paenibacillus sp. V4I7]MDQ0903970.1 O-antigen/teichoic acid export membrane protein [Paenibacillus sp. V4I7]